MKRFGSTRWNRGLREGKGAVSTESRALENYPYSFFTRYGEKPGTNPEELLGAAHAWGHILLCSADPLAHPRIFPNYFSEPEDLRALARSVSRMREMMRGSGHS
jgi:hypothetical protein